MKRRGRPPSVIWTEEMLETLRDMRSRGAPLFMCADRIGVAYATAVLKARELGIADRMPADRRAAWRSA